MSSVFGTAAFRNIFSTALGGLKEDLFKPFDFAIGAANQGQGIPAPALTPGLAQATPLQRHTRLLQERLFDGERPPKQTRTTIFEPSASKDSMHHTEAWVPVKFIAVVAGDVKSCKYGSGLKLEVSPLFIILSVLTHHHRWFSRLLSPKTRFGLLSL